jgi:hypothetical protein
MNYEISFLKALILTITIETFTIFIFSKCIFRKSSYKIYTLLVAGILPSLLTLPYLWFILPVLIKTKIFYILISELSAVILESFIIKEILRINYLRALILSMVCNTLSYCSGLLLHRFII